jgi:hypothetical protein
LANLGKHFRYDYGTAYWRWAQPNGEFDITQLEPGPGSMGVTLPVTGEQSMKVPVVDPKWQ